MVRGGLPAPLRDVVARFGPPRAAAVAPGSTQAYAALLHRLPRAATAPVSLTTRLIACADAPHFAIVHRALQHRGLPLSAAQAGLLLHAASEKMAAAAARASGDGARLGRQCDRFAATAAAADALWRSVGAGADPSGLRARLRCLAVQGRVQEADDIVRLRLQGTATAADWHVVMAAAGLRRLSDSVGGARGAAFPAALRAFHEMRRVSPPTLRTVALMADAAETPQDAAHVTELWSACVAAPAAPATHCAAVAGVFRAIGRTFPGDEVLAALTEVHRRFGAAAPASCTDDPGVLGALVEATGGSASPDAAVTAVKALGTAPVVPDAVHFALVFAATPSDAGRGALQLATLLGGASLRPSPTILNAAVLLAGAAAECDMGPQDRAAAARLVPYVAQSCRRRGIKADGHTLGALLFATATALRRGLPVGRALEVFLQASRGLDLTDATPDALLLGVEVLRAALGAGAFTDAPAALEAFAAVIDSAALGHVARAWASAGRDERELGDATADTAFVAEHRPTVLCLAECPDATLGAAVAEVEAGGGPEVIDFGLWAALLEADGLPFARARGAAQHRRILLPSIAAALGTEHGAALDAALAAPLPRRSITLPPAPPRPPTVFDVFAASALARLGRAGSTPLTPALQRDLADLFPE